ncbi:MAG: hypothetical protein OXG33_04840 [Chloroflexi bacterium]|nr:hypothetical protein [Chloroflexota bacterium]
MREADAGQPGDARGELTPFAAKYRLERELRPFTRDEVRRLPRDRSGLYALWLAAETEGGHERLYLGMSTTCVRRRLLDHLSNETNPELRRELRLFGDRVEFSAVFTTGDRETRELESALLRDWRPDTNRWIPAQ